MLRGAEVQVVALERRRRAARAVEDEAGARTRALVDVHVHARQVGEVALLHVADLLDEDSPRVRHEEVVLGARRVLHVLEEGEDVVQVADHDLGVGAAVARHPPPVATRRAANRLGRHAEPLHVPPHAHMLTLK